MSATTRSSALGDRNLPNRRGTPQDSTVIGIGRAPGRTVPDGRVAWKDVIRGKGKETVARGETGAGSGTCLG